MNFSDVGYFGEILLENGRESSAETTMITDDILENVAYQIIEEQSFPAVDRYLLATSNLDDNEFQNVINQMKHKIL